MEFQIATDSREKPSTRLYMKKPKIYLIQYTWEISMKY